MPSLHTNAPFQPPKHPSSALNAASRSAHCGSNWVPTCVSIVSVHPKLLSVAPAAELGVDLLDGGLVALQPTLPGLRPAGFLAVSDLLRRGWTDAMIRDLLGAADATARNPHCAHSHPMRLYTTSRVASAERSPSFLERLEAAHHKRAVGKATARRRRAELLEWAAHLHIEAPPIQIPRLRRICEDYFAALSDTDLESLPFVIDRVMATDRHAQLVIYLALQMACHEEALAPFIGAPGYPEAIAAIRLRILDAIATAYPVLGEAARGVRLRRVDRQMLRHGADHDDMPLVVPREVEPEAALALAR